MKTNKYCNNNISFFVGEEHQQRLKGQPLISKTVATASNTLEIGKLSAGIYLVRVTTTNNKVVSSKLVIE